MLWWTKTVMKSLLVGQRLFHVSFFDYSPKSSSTYLTSGCLARFLPPFFDTTTVYTSGVFLCPFRGGFRLVVYL